MEKFSSRKPLMRLGFILAAIPFSFGVVNLMGSSSEVVAVLSGYPYWFLSAPTVFLAEIFGLPLFASDAFGVPEVTSLGVLLVTGFYLLVGYSVAFIVFAQKDKNATNSTKVGFGIVVFMTILVVFSLVTYGLLHTLTIPCGLKFNIQSSAGTDLARDRCYADQAKLPNRGDPCLSATDERIRSTCYRNLAVSTGDQAICERLFPGDDFGGQQERNYCYYKVALQKQDPEICNNVKLIFATDEDTVVLKNLCFSLDAEQQGWGE